MILSIERLQERLAVANIKELAKHSGVHFNTLYRLRADKTERVSKQAIKQLSEFYLKLESGEISQ